MSADLFVTLFDFSTLVIGLGYPIWRSYKVIEAVKVDNDTFLWLVFWIIYAAINKAETALAFSISLVYSGNPTWIVYVYKLLKLLVQVWLFHPNFQGALYIYYKFLGKYQKKVEPEQVKFVKNILTEADSILNKAKVKGLEIISQNTNREGISPRINYEVQRKAASTDSDPK